MTGGGPGPAGRGGDAGWDVGGWRRGHVVLAWLSQGAGQRCVRGAGSPLQDLAQEASGVGGGVDAVSGNGAAASVYCAGALAALPRRRWERGAVWKPLGPLGLVPAAEGLVVQQGGRAARRWRAGRLQ